MRIRKPYVASLDQVWIRREDEYAVIEYADPNVGGVHLKIGPKIKEMTDKEILDLHNRCIEARDQLAAEYEHVAVEIPIGRPQLEYFTEGDYWVPRGGVLRCQISDGGPEGETTIDIDDRELSLEEFGKVLSLYTGWAMRIVFVPEDEIYQEPLIETREPDEKGS